jgi:predicted Fe-Mo cluster-binding NifX family protein
MRIAVPIWENRISPVLDTASRLLIVEKEEQREAIRSETLLEEQDIHRRCLRIKGLGIDILICGAVSQSLLKLLTASGIQIIYGISGNPEDVLDAYFEGALDHTRFFMPGFKRKRFGRRGRASNFGKDGSGKGKKQARQIPGRDNTKRRGQG